MHHQKRVAIHFLIVFGSHVYGEPKLSYGGINVHGHALRGRPGHTRLLAGLPIAGALLAKAARVHEHQKSPFIACQKDLPLKFGQLGVDLAGPGVAAFGLVHGAFKVQDDRIAVFVEKLLAFGHRRRMGRARGYSAVPAAAEFAFHAHPLGHDDFFGVNPFVVGVVFFLEYRIQ